jgi:two-component system, chemotaxis family, chemotaxis protein CheY
VAGRTILIVDDSAAVRSIIKVYLAWEKHELLEAQDGERAWQIVRLMPVDMIIADVNMPNLDGISFTRRVRGAADETVRTIPVLLITGDKNADVRARAMAAGANALVRKPVTNEELIHLVRQHMRPELDAP